MKSKIKENIPIIFILALASLLYILNIWGEGFANSYYAAGAYSMGQNLHAFFFNSLDSVGFVTIDKPPLGFWIQVLFTKAFGFSGGVLVLPEAISGVLSVYLIYKIVKKRFNKAAGLISAAILALTPIFAAVSRNNTIDGILILLLVLAADQAIKAAEKSSMKHLIFAGIFIGLGFNVKMLQAFMIVPAVYIIYIIFAKQRFFKKILACALSVIILLALSLSWVVAVDLVDEDSRPYIGSSDTNSALELVFGHNGVSRIFGRSSSIKNNALRDDEKPNLPQDRNPSIGAYDMRQKPIVNQQTNKNLPIKNSGSISGETGDASVFRLFNDKNAGQISWFILPAMIVALISLFLIFIKKHRNNKKFITYFFFSMWILPMYIYFSFAEGITHRYYFAMIAPGIAALIGIGIYYLLRLKNKMWMPITFAATAVVQIYIHSLYNGWMDLMITVCGVVFVLAFFAMIIMVIKNTKAKYIAATMCVLFLLPTLWATSPLMYSDNSQLPIAGPELINQKDSFDNVKDFSLLVDYLEDNRDGATYLTMAESSMSGGAELILQSGEAVMVLGGFNGGDETLTLIEFIKMVDRGEVKYAVLSQNGNQKSNSKIFEWIQKNAKVVPLNKYGGRAANIRLFELK